MKIPQQAKLVFKGIIFSVYQWQQEQFDGSYQTFEAIQRGGTVQIIPTFKDKILLSYEEQPMKPKTFTFFGGKMDENEDPLTTAKRELKEETGMESDDWELLKEYDSKGNIDWNTYLFIARNCKKVDKQHLDAGERIEIKTVTFEEFLRIVSEEAFWGMPQIIIDILRIRLDIQQQNKLKEKLKITT
jgi:ADP-ribose pyrophosphatase